MKQEDCSEEESDTFYQTQKRRKLTPSGTRFGTMFNFFNVLDLKFDCVLS